MTENELACKDIKAGNAARYIKPRWIDQINGVLSTEAFDLRDVDPPETYVSHFIAEGNSSLEIFHSAYSLISQRMQKCDKGSIAILDIREALMEVNDEVEPFIAFVEKGLSHCGLKYVTSKQEKIQEAKATLCFIAKKNMKAVNSINNLPTNTVTTQGRNP